MISKKDISIAVKKAGLSKKCLVLHSSFSSFGGVREGPQGVLDAFFENNCTVMAPTFSWRFEVPPPPDMRPEQNGIDYNTQDSFMPGKNMVYTPASSEIVLEYMGIIPKTMLEAQGRVRGAHPLCSFSAYGPFANELIKGQQPMDIFAPLRELALFNGYIVLAGVNYNRLTMLHMVEQMLGKNMFIRWANDTNKKPAMCENGGCSEGFYKTEPFLKSLEKQVEVGESLWRIIPAGVFLKAAARFLQLKPGITHCDNTDCIRCNDMAKGGPILNLK